MGYREIQDSSLSVGRSINQILLNLIRANFATHESRISDIEGSQSSVPTGMTLPYGGSSAPTGFLICDGSEVSRTTYADLFSIIGTLYGTPSNSAVFKLPGTPGRTPVGSSGSLSVGDDGGEETHQLTSDEIPSHTHGLTDPGHAHAGVYNDTGGALDYRHRSIDVSSNADATSTAAPTSAASTGISIGTTGSNGSHNNVQPSLVVNFVIKT